MEPFLKKKTFFLLFLKSFPLISNLIPNIPKHFKNKVFKNDFKFLKIYLSPFLTILNPLNIVNVKKDIFLYQKAYRKDKKYCFFKKLNILKKLCL